MASYNSYLVQKPETLQNNCEKIRIIFDTISTTSVDIANIYSNYTEYITAFKNENNSFYVSETDLVAFGKFNLILFFDKSDNLLAYTKFNSDLEYKADLYITANFSVEYENSIDKNLTATITFNDKSLIGEELFEYTNFSKIIEEEKLHKYISTYSTSVESTLRDDSCILNTLSSVKGGRMRHLDFSRNIDMKDSQMKPFSSFWIGVFRNDVALYGWRFNEDRNIEIRIISLSRQNLFGDPILLTRKGFGYSTLKCNNLNPRDIRYCAGKYAILDCKDNKTFVFNIETEKQVLLENKDFCIDSFDAQSRLIIEPISLPLNTIYPELNDLNTVITSLTPVYKKCGSWLVSTTNNGLLYQSPYISEIIPVDQKVILVNDQNYLIQKDNIWYLYQGKEKTEFKIDLDNIYNSALLGFKRNQFYTGKIKDIIGAYKGLVFYISEDNKINFL